MLRHRPVLLGDVDAGVDGLRRARAKAIHELAHAVGNSLLVLEFNAQALLAQKEDPALHDIQEAARAIDRLLSAWKQQLELDPGLPPLPPQPLRVSTIARAATEAGLEVESDANAPEVIHVDPLAIQRVTSHLFVAATKMAIRSDESSLVMVVELAAPDPFRAPDGALANVLVPLASIGARIELSGTTMTLRLPVQGESEALQESYDALVAKIVTKT